jgi:integrase
MPRIPAWPPVPYRHSSGRARVKIDGKAYYLGPYGSSEAARNLKHLVTRIELERAGKAPPDEMTVSALCGMYLEQQAKERQDRQGNPTQEMGHISRVVRTLIHAHGPMLAREVEPRHIKEVRDLFIHGYEHPAFETMRPQSRKTVKANLSRLKGVFKWAALENLISAESFQRIRLVRAPRVNEPGVTESLDVLPVPEKDLEKTLPHLGYPVRQMVDVQLLCGCRPGEICRLCPGDIDRHDLIWEWKLKEHKTAWRGHTRVILLGPKAQAILTPFLLRPADKPCFSPREAYAIGRSKVDRTDTYAPRDYYTSWTYWRAIQRACRRADVPSWSPGQLRHLAATRIVNEFGWEVARDILGHRDFTTTAIYVKPDTAKSQAALKKIG